MTFSAEMIALAETVLETARQKGLHLATAESCTGGLIAGLLTEIPGSSDVLERGFVVYANEAKEEMLGVPRETLAAHGAVSPETAAAMVEGALVHSRAQIAVAVTGVAGPGGGTREKPVGLVYVAVRCGADTTVRRCLFGDAGRDAVRRRTIETALHLLLERMRG